MRIHKQHVCKIKGQIGKCEEVAAPVGSCTFKCLGPMNDDIGVVDGR